MNTKPRRSNLQTEEFPLGDSALIEDAVLISPPPKRRPFETRSILALAVLSLTLLPFFYGGRNDSAVYVFQISILVLAAIFGAKRLIASLNSQGTQEKRAGLGISSASLCVLSGLMMSFVCLAFFQTIELPLSLLRYISPRAADAYSLSGLESGSVSLEIGATTAAAWMVLCVSLLCIGVIALPIEAISTRPKRDKGSHFRRKSSQRYSSSRRDRVIHILQTQIIIVGVIVSLVAIGHWTMQTELLFGIFAPNRTLYSGTTPHWPFVNPDHLSIFLEVGIVVAAALFFRFLYVAREESRRGSAEARFSIVTFLLQPEKFGRLVYLSAAVVVMLICSLLTLSRAGNSLALLGIAVLSFQFLRMLPRVPLPRRSPDTGKSSEAKKLTFRRHLMRRVVYFLVALFAFGALISFLVGESGRHALYERVDYGLTVRYEQLRAELSRVSWETFLANPTMGVGLGNWHLAAGEFGSEEFAGFRLDFAHNELLQLAAETGSVGVAILFLGIGTLALWTISVWRKPLPVVTRMDLHGTTLALSLPIAHSFVDFPLHIPALAVLLAICLAVHVRMLLWIASSERASQNRASREEEMLNRAASRS